MLRSQNNYNNIFRFLAISKHLNKSTQCTAKVKKGQIYFISTTPFKYSFKSLIWYFFIITGSKPKFNWTNKLKMFDSKYTISGLLLNTNKYKFLQSFSKINDVLLPNLENEQLLFFKKGNFLTFVFRRCLTSPELDTFYEYRKIRLMIKFHVALNILTNTYEPFQNEFLLRYLELTVFFTNKR